AWRINWNAKSENLRSLGEELGLPLDAFIFVDDDPVECAEIEAACPEILTLQLPRESNRIPHFLEHVWAFDHAVITHEDAQRTALVRQSLACQQLRRESLDLASFLAGLNLEVSIAPMQPDQLARVAQLTQRTNQLNMT